MDDEKKPSLIVSAAVALAALLPVFADVPDLTASMVPLCNPNATRWTTSQMFSRAVTSIGVHDGLLFVSGGDWNDNTGPCPIFAINPYTGSYRNEWDAGTECVNYYREGSDGCVYIPSIDPKDGHANCCDVSRRNPNGTWTKLNIAPNVWLYWSSKENAAYGTHTWDVAIWKGKIFTAGYGIGVGPEKTTSRLLDATPGLPDAYRRYAGSFGGTFQRPRRFEAFLPFGDELFAIPLNYASIQSANFKVWDFEEWRFDESTSKFVCQTNTAANIVPGLKATDFGLFGSRTDLDIQLWNPTKFKGRVLYIPGNEHGTTKPVAALYIATNENHHVKATRVEFGSGVYPFDIFARDDVVLVVTAQYDSAKSNVVNSVWESTDGVSFVKKFFFSAPQHASAMAYLDGSYYFAMGTRTTVSTAWTLKGSDVAGQIYRIRDPDCASAIEIVAENATVSLPEGGTAAARFKLAAQPSTSVTAGVRIVYAGVPAVTTTVASVTFTPQDWNVWHEVPVAAAEDDLDTVRSATLFFGVGAPAALRATSITVTPVNNDPVGLTRASTGGIYTNSASHATYGVKGAFDGNRVDTNGRWLASKADHMYVVYKFNEATAVNTLRVWNGSNSGGGASSAERSPKSWTFYGSNDGSTWTALDTRTNEPDWSANGEMRDYQFQNDEAYLYYKYDCTELCSTSATYLQLWELEFYYIEDDSQGGGDPEVPQDPPDLTDSLEYLGNPAYTRWPGSPMSRHVQDLFPYKGKIYTSGGEWDTNTGPCPIWAVDPYSGAYTNEFDAGTDAIYEFKVLADGRLYTSAIDPHENAANIGSIFRRGSNDVWYAYNTACTACNITNFGSSAYQGYRIHNWDMAEYKDYVFVCGYGISGSTNWCTTAMFDTTPQLRNIDRHCGPVSWTIPGRTYGATASDYQLLRRFCTFLPFDDDIYCFPDQPTFWDKITHFNWEEWRFNESTKKFVCQTNTWENIAPGITLEAASFTHPSNDAAQVQLWHPTKFGSRVLYIVGGHGPYGFNITPWAAYSAVNENHHVKATKIDLGGDDVKPFDICVANGTAYIVAAQAGMKATQVTNSVWKSSGGVSFTKIFTFVSTRQASAICYYDGCFYLGMGSNSFTKNGWPKVTGTDVSGCIYRVRLPQGSAPTVLASTNAVAVVEGGSGSVAFRLAAKPATNMTLRVWSTDPRIVSSVASLSFTTSNWNANQSVAFSTLEDDESDANFKGVIVCGTGAADCQSAYVVVTVTNNDFRVIETPPEGLVDLTRPEGDWMTTIAVTDSTHYVFADAPFNDCTVNDSTNKTERFLVRSTAVTVQYRFDTPTIVNAYGIVNFARANLSPVERAPRVWTFAGSDDGTTWTQLDVRRFEKDWTAGEYRYYSFANTAAYRFYRIAITANNGNEYTQFARMEMYGTAGQGGDPEPEPLVSDFAKKTTFIPSATALAKIGGSSWTNFPVLVRLPASVSSQLRSAGGTDLRVEDESGAELPFEVETFNPAGTTFVWVKVPALSSSTKLTVFFSGAANTNNDPTAVWSRYAGVWHFAPSAAGTMTVPDATGNGLAGTTTNTLAAYEGPAGLGALQAGAVVRAPDYDAKLDNAVQFSASGWFKAPNQVNSWMSVASKKVGITTAPNGENLWNINKGWYLQLPQVKNKLDLIYDSKTEITIPDVTSTWNYFQVVSDGSTVKVYMNGSTTAAISVSYAVKASGTPYQVCPKDGCSREYRVRKGAASAAETALEYATMADENFFAMGEMETVGVFVPAPAFGGEGVPAPSFGVDQSSGNPVFTFSIGNAVKGVKYRIYMTESLSEPFMPYGDAIEATEDGLLGLSAETENRPSCFFKVEVVK